MAKWIDIDPRDPTDILKKRFEDAKNKQTIPHGVKVARAGEYISFYDSEGSSHVWDGDTIAAYDARISEATAAIDATRVSLDAAKADLEEAKSRIQASGGDFSEYADRIADSEKKLADALKAQQALELTVSTTKSDVQVLASKTDATAQEVQSVADSLSNVSSVAQQAQDAAAQAQSAANEVSAQADNAAGTAQKALDEARAPVTGDRIVINADLASRLVNAMDVTTKRLVVTEDALLNNATFLGSTVAQELNVTKKLVARDAIVNGTLDVAQLNVTAEMSAEIVKAMSVEAKKLVVTDDAILNRLTVIQNIVTPELVAQKINVKQLGADLVTAGAIQTSTSANRGLKMTSTGLKGYDDSGNLTMDFNGKDNKLVGNLSTSAEAYTGINLVHRGTVAGIELYSGTKTANNSLIYSHGSVWYSTPNFPPDDRGMFICATDKSAVQDPDPGIWLKPSSGIGFQGSFTRNSPAFASGVVEHASVAAGGWVAMDVKFLPAMQPGTNIQVHISPVTESGVECSIGLKNVTNTGFQANVVNESPRASGYMWLKWFAIAIR